MPAFFEEVGGPADFPQGYIWLLFYDTLNKLEFMYSMNDVLSYAIMEITRCTAAFLVDGYF